ncbi:hypothetical protein GCM10027277_22490 [Pseudoduganella ginsengisoli]|nr:YjbH domain-containing protein [Pseudoduganella ginsengisoli]
MSDVLAFSADSSALDAPLRHPAEVGAMAMSGSSGALTVPDGAVLRDGVAVFGLNNASEPEFYKQKRGENYQFGIGLLPYVELSGRLANYPGTPSNNGVRDLSANVKIGIPKIFNFQPDIAFGVNDLGGGNPYFSSKYVAVSDTWGPLRLNIGKASGQTYLRGMFGSAEYALWNSGASVLAERVSGGYVAGMRYVSRPLSQFANTHIVVGVQRTLGMHAPDGVRVNNSGVNLALTVPFGPNARAVRKVSLPDEPIWTPPVPSRTGSSPQQSNSMAPLWTPPSGVDVGGAQVDLVGAKTSDIPAEVLQRIQVQVEKAGLERVRVGQRGNELVIEYENHRYNQNEADALGIVLGVGAVAAPADVATVSAVTKKTGLPLYQVSIDRRSYARFLRDGSDYEARSTLSVRYRPGDGSDVRWLNNAEGARGYSRVRIDPQLIKFVGTELGVFDYSLSMNIQAYVPLWRGAEAGVSYVRTLAESDDVKHGFLGYAQQPNKLKAAILSQAFWVTDRVLNVTTGGKFNYDATGFQNETTWFVPYRDDQVRLQASRMHRIDFYGLRQDIRAASASYLWAYQPLGITAELGYNRYQSKDKGPSLQLSRWYGDIQAQAYLRTSEADKKVGFSLAFPLTPRQGMRPGWTHLEGSSSFPFKLETRLASKGKCNCITNSVVEELPMVYSARGNLLNHARTGKDYFVSQLQRMREAALVYASVVP